ncbi:MAG: hypothetical protein VX454_05185 [Pseudomonadota bacterium]|jgi:hypothetical protein|nr:hypothetical protein [Pseudomonadota bacterium]
MASAIVTSAVRKDANPMVCRTATFPPSQMARPDHAERKGKSEPARAPDHRVGMGGDEERPDEHRSDQNIGQDRQDGLGHGRDDDPGVRFTRGSGWFEKPLGQVWLRTGKAPGRP